MTTDVKLEHPANGVPEQRKKIHPHKFTMWIAIVSILMMFAGLTSAFIIKSNLVGWRTIKMPQIFWLSTAVILISSFTIQWAVRSFKLRNKVAYRTMLITTLALGVAFLFMQWAGFNEIWNEQKVHFKGVTGAGQFLYVIFGLHALHVVGGVVALIFMGAKAILPSEKRIYNAVPIELAAIYWHFVDVLWIYLLVFFIIVG